MTTRRPACSTCSASTARSRSSPAPSSGLGVAFAQALAEAGADVALGARRVDRLEETKALVEQAGRRAVTVATDVARPEDCQALVDATMEAFEAGRHARQQRRRRHRRPRHRETPEQFRDVIDVNLNGCYWSPRRAAG